jgi:uncharacterized protein (UPF0332 family)
MIGDEMLALVRYRLEQAEQALRDGRTLLGSGSYNATVNRAYYAMFYAILALLCVRGRGTSKHTGALELFDREFVRTGAFDKEMSRWLHEAFDLRQGADYKEMVLVTRERAEKAIQNAEMFVSQVKGYLGRSIGEFSSQ